MWRWVVAGRGIPMLRQSSHNGCWSIMCASINALHYQTYACCLLMRVLPGHLLLDSLTIRYVNALTYLGQEETVMSCRILNLNNPSWFVLAGMFSVCLAGSTLAQSTGR